MIRTVVTLCVKHVQPVLLVSGPYAALHVLKALENSGVLSIVVGDCSLLWGIIYFALEGDSTLRADKKGSSQHVSIGLLLEPVNSSSVYS